MVDGTRSTMTRWRGFCAVLLASWLLSKMHWSLWVGSLTALWRSGAVANFKVTDQRSERSVTVNVTQGKVTVQKESHVTMA